MALQLVQLAIDLPAALIHAEVAGLTHAALADEGGVLKTALWEAFDGPAVRPWRVERQHGPTLTVVGYSRLDEPELVSRLAVALPSVHRAVRLVATRTPPDLRSGARIALDLRLCPTVHVTAGQLGLRPGERDAFLYAVDLAVARFGEGARLGVTREAVYADYLVAQHRPGDSRPPPTTRLPGVRLVSATMRGFRLVPMARKDRGSWSPARTAPVAEMALVADIEDPDEVLKAMAAGVGRQRAYGCGMLVIRRVSGP